MEKHRRLEDLEAENLRHRGQAKPIKPVAKVPPDEKACYICGKKGHFFRMAQPAADYKGSEKVEKVSSFGTIGRHANETYLEIEVNGR